MPNPLTKDWVREKYDSDITPGHVVLIKFVHEVFYPFIIGLAGGVLVVLSWWHFVSINLQAILSFLATVGATTGFLYKYAGFKNCILDN